MEKRLMDVVAPLITDREPTVLRKPRQCALHNPAVSPQLLAALYALSCYTALYPALPQGPFALFVVVGFVGVQLLGTFPRPSPTGTLDGLYGVDEFFKDYRVVDVRCGEHYRKWDTPSVGHSMALGALLSFIRRIHSVFAPPFWRGWKPNRGRHAPSRSGRLFRGGRARCGAASPTPRPLSTP